MTDEKPDQQNPPDTDFLYEKLRELGFDEDMIQETRAYRATGLCAIEAPPDLVERIMERIMERTKAATEGLPPPAPRPPAP